MANYDWRVVTPVEAEGKETFWQQIGVGWNNKGGSISITLNALPINGRIVLFEPTEADDKTAAPVAGRGRSQRSQAELDDEIPF